MAMVVHGKPSPNGLGGHISTYASSATLYEVGFNHFFRGGRDDHPGTSIYIPGPRHPRELRPGVPRRPARPKDLQNFRRELADGGGLSSYPHPYLMPDFWQFPTVSMGLGPIMSLYQARFNRYLKARGLPPGQPEPKVWCFVGDGESRRTRNARRHHARLGRETSTTSSGSSTATSSASTDPVRGNGKIIQELEGAFRGAGWNVIKVIWGRDWDPLWPPITTDSSSTTHGGMSSMATIQKYSVEPGSYIRKHFFGKYPELLPGQPPLGRSNHQAAARRP
jgi:pyruvate dehydrogenase E1 component